MASCNLRRHAHYLDACAYMCLHACMLVACILLFSQTEKYSLFQISSAKQDLSKQLIKMSSFVDKEVS